MRARIDDLDGGIDLALGARDRGEARSIGVLANAVDLVERLLARGLVPDLLTDQTSAHDELNGYVPHGLPYEDALRLRSKDPEAYRRRAIASRVVSASRRTEMRAVPAPIPTASPLGETAATVGSSERHCS